MDKKAWPQKWHFVYFGLLIFFSLATVGVGFLQIASAPNPHRLSTFSAFLPAVGLASVSLDVFARYIRAAKR